MFKLSSEVKKIYLSIYECQHNPIKFYKNDLSLWYVKYITSKIMISNYFQNFELMALSNKPMVIEAGGGGRSHLDLGNQTQCVYQQKHMALIPVKTNHIHIMK